MFTGEGVLLAGERVALGPLRRDLVPLYTSWDNDAELCALRGNPLVPRTPEQVERRLFDDTPETTVLFTVYETVIESKAPRAIGMAMLMRVDRIHRTAELGIFLGARDAWNVGLGTEATTLVLDYAFQALGLHAVYLRVIADNARAIKAYERAGFKKIGVQRQSCRVGQEVHDDLYMDILASEFESPVLKRVLAGALTSPSAS